MSDESDAVTRRSVLVVEINPKRLASLCLIAVVLVLLASSCGADRQGFTTIVNQADVPIFPYWRGFKGPGPIQPGATGQDDILLTSNRDRKWKFEARDPENNVIFETRLSESELIAQDWTIVVTKQNE